MLLAATVLRVSCWSSPFFLCLFSVWSINNVSSNGELDELVHAQITSAGKRDLHEGA